MRIERLANNPIIHPGLSPDVGDNINGPSLIEAPDWLPNRLARYYLYFGHHSGKFIRLAVSDQLTGPWRVVEGGVLGVEKSFCVSHIASPDAHVDHVNKRIVMYYHGPSSEADRPRAREIGDVTGFNFTQVTRVALSSDGVRFEALEEMIAPAYLRRFDFDGWCYAVCMPMFFLRSRDGITAWEPGPCFMDQRVRHCATLARHGKLLVFYSQREDCPERILCTRFDLTGDWRNWTHVTPWDVLSPETDWEGGNQPLVPSVSGKVSTAVRQLRDPGTFTGEKGEDYLLYSVAGEQGIAIARLHLEPTDWTRVS